MYRFMGRLRELYGLLRDDLSKEIFKARLLCDLEPSIPNIRRLALLGPYKDLTPLGWSRAQKDALRKLNREQKKIILYGAGHTGRITAEMLGFEHIEFYGFCGRNAARFPDGLLGKPVITPDEMIAHSDEYYVMPAVGNLFYPEILRFLRENSYPEEHMLGWIDCDPLVDNEQYFEFPALYRRGTAFVDGGCFDCGDSYRFAEWCGGEYSSIIAFEPDPGNYAGCRKKLQDVPLPNIQLINAGMSNEEGTAVLSANSTAESRIISGELPGAFNFTQTTTEKQVTIRTAALDGVVGDRAVGFIKMDVEGSELAALHGAKNTILRDKPLLAISAYHLRGDMPAIMDHLHQQVPEYRFWLRHYSTVYETVLYASVDAP